MKKYFFLGIILLSALNAGAQVNKNFVKIAETESAFAKIASQKSTKEAFLEFLTEDALMFAPALVNGREYFASQPASPGLLSWYPTFIDASANGVFAYSTGRGEFRPKGKDDSTVYYSDYLTVWRRQPNNEYKTVLDVGVYHDKPVETDRNWKSPSESKRTSSNEKIAPATNAVNLFYDTAASKGLNSAYKMFAAEDARFLREGKQPVIGKKNALAQYQKGRQTISFGKNMTLQSAGNLAYSVTAYTLKSDKLIEKGSSIQIWKFTNGKWQIVADVFAPIPEK